MYSVSSYRSIANKLCWDFTVLWRFPFSLRNTIDMFTMQASMPILKTLTLTWDSEDSTAARWDDQLRVLTVLGDNILWYTLLLSCSGCHDSHKERQRAEAILWWECLWWAHQPTNVCQQYPDPISTRLSSQGHHARWRQISGKAEGTDWRSYFLRSVFSHRWHSDIYM